MSRRRLFRGRAGPDEPPLTDWQKDELDRRLAEMEADPDGGLTMQQVFDAIRRNHPRNPAD